MRRLGETTAVSHPPIESVAAANALFDAHQAATSDLIGPSASTGGEEYSTRSNIRKPSACPCRVEPSLAIMAGLVPAIRVFARRKAWMPGTGPGMTIEKSDSI